MGEVDPLRLVPDSGATPADLLKPGELRVLRLFAEGKTWSQVAHEMHISKNTISQYVTRAFTTLGATCREDAYRSLGWLVLPDD